MLVVLDAGVFVSAAITPGGVASRIVMAGIQRRFEYLLCPMLVGEITAVMRRPKIVRVVSQEDSQRFLDDALAGGRDVGDPPEIVSHSRDPDDDYLFALAAEHHADTDECTGRSLSHRATEGPSEAADGGARLTDVSRTRRHQAVRGRTGRMPHPL